MDYVKNIRDPIHGTISLTELELKLLDTREMQRLRFIKQNGLCYLVYPAMNSTRFEHSLGAMHIAGLLSDHLELSVEDKKKIRAACLLHDIGHAPFSHATDEIMAEHNDSHEENSARIIQKTEIADHLEKHGLEPKEIADLIRGKGRLSKILCSEIDVDKMDYLVRDSYYAGVAYGTIDLERLIYGIKLVGDDLVVKRGNLEAVEFLLISRNLMYETVYRHHTKRIAETMIKNALTHLLKKKLKYQDFLALDDVDLSYRMRHAGGYTQEMMKRIDERNLFKAVFQERMILVEETFREDLIQKREKIEDKIAKDHGIKKGHLLLDIPETKMPEFRAKVETDEGLKRIDEVSSLARTLEKSEQEKITFCIYTPTENNNKLKHFNPEKYIEFAQTRLGKFI